MLRTRATFSWQILYISMYSKSQHYGGEQSVSNSGPFSAGIRLQCSINCGLSGLQGRFGRFEKEKKIFASAGN